LTAPDRRRKITVESIIDRRARGGNAGKGALIGTGVGAAAGAIYDITKK